MVRVTLFAVPLTAWRYFHARRLVAVDRRLAGYIVLPGPRSGRLVLKLCLFLGDDMALQRAATWLIRLGIDRGFLLLAVGSNVHQEELLLLDLALDAIVCDSCQL